MVSWGAMESHGHRRSHEFRATSILLFTIDAVAAGSSAELSAKSPCRAGLDTSTNPTKLTLSLASNGALSSTAARPFHHALPLPTTLLFLSVRNTASGLTLLLGSPRSLSEDPRGWRVFGDTLHVQLELPTISSSDSGSRGSGIAFPDSCVGGEERLIGVQPDQIGGSPSVAQFPVLRKQKLKE